MERAAALQAEGKLTSICSYCSRMKRGILYQACRREGYNVLALGQHLDDLAESFVMSAFYNGKLRTMKANYRIGKGDLRVIRPLIYVREAMTRSFSQSNILPIIEDNCPACFEAPKQRHRVKRVLAAQEHENPELMGNLLRAMKPIININNSQYNLHGDTAPAEGDEDDDEDVQVEGDLAT